MDKKEVDNMAIQSSQKVERKYNINLVLVSLVFILVGILGSLLLGFFEDLSFWSIKPVGTTMYFLLSEICKVLFITGSVTIFLHILFKKISEIETKERESRLKGQLKSLECEVKRITQELAKYIGSLGTIITERIVAIHKSRDDAKDVIKNELKNKENNKIRIIGISLRDFLKGDRLFYGEWGEILERLKDKGDNLKVQLLLIDPCCKQAVDRAESEEPRVILHGERNLYIEVTQILTTIDDMLIGVREGSLEVKIYDTSPNCFLIITDNYTFVEQYHYREEITSGFMPVIQYDITSKVGKEMIRHFDFVWSRSRDFKTYIKEKQRGIAEAIKDSKIVNMYLDRELLTKRLTYLIETVPGEIAVVGISLSSYITPGSILISGFDMKEKLNRSIRLLLLNPLSKQAKYRGAKESNHPYKGYTLAIHKQHRLYNDTMASIREVDRLATLENPIRGKLYSSAPSCFCFITEESIFIEQYHYGQTAAAKRVKETVLSRVVPVIEYTKDSTVYSLMKDHFDYVWEECSISLKEFEGEKDTLEKEFNAL